MVDRAKKRTEFLTTELAVPPWRKAELYYQVQRPTRVDAVRLADVRMTIESITVNGREVPKDRFPLPVLSIGHSVRLRIANGPELQPVSATLDLLEVF
jgi:hypothetical protein